MIGKSITLLLPPGCEEEEGLIFERILVGEQVKTFDSVRVHKNGESIHVALTISPIFNADGKVIGASKIARDITQSRNERTQMDLLAACMRYSNDSVMITDAEPIDLPGPRIVYINDAFERLTGYTKEDALGNTPRMLQGPKSDPDVLCQIREALSQWRPICVELINYTKDGREFWSELDINPMADSGGYYTHWISVQRDITERKHAATRIEHMAFYDQLTNLPNREFLLNRMEASQKLSLETKSYGALLYIDLGNFKNVNYTFGHDSGNEILKEAATRLLKCVCEEGTVARFGGDEFVILLENLSMKRSEAVTMSKDMARKALNSFKANFEVAKNIYCSAPSIGVSVFSGHQEGLAESVIKQADLAMDAAKNEGRNRFQFYDRGMQSRIDEHATIEAELHTALALKQFSLAYQAQFNQIGKIVGAEALLRMHHPDKGIIAPGSFIQVAEETGLIFEIGMWVLEEACKDLVSWSNNPEMNELTVAINVSALQFEQSDFFECAQVIIEKTGINPHLLKFELTESILLNDVDSVIIKMNLFNAIGIQFNLDDFGTGYSSLAYLKKLPLKCLKIDRSFVLDIPGDNNACAIATSIIAMASSLKLVTVAEGIETSAQMKYLREAGCDHFQGYLLSRPIPLAEFIDLVKSASKLENIA
jgi:diguanylate cyclase (GGDEF)-like protein/PAS domain S-box-containing protein